MGSEYKQIKLEEFAIHQKGFAFKSKDYVESGVAVVRVSNFTDNSIDTSDLKFISNDIASDKGNFRLLHDDVVIATVGSWPKNPASVVGKVISVPKKCNEFLLNQNAVRFRAKSGEPSDQLFLYYLLKSKSFSEYLISTAQGSANQASITLKDIYAYEFECPDFFVRENISKTLSGLDKKITLNNQTNQTLEQMAQALFKSWFVDFDPVIDNALAAGHAIPDELQERAERRQQVLAAANTKRLPAAIQQLFPSEFEDSELGWIPKGWEVKTIDELSKINPESWTSKNTPVSVQYVDLANAKKGTIGDVVEYEFEEAPSRARRILRIHDTIIGVVRPANRSFAYVNKNDLTGSTGFAVVRPRKDNYRSFLYLALTDEDHIAEFARIADGAAYPAIKPEDVAKATCVYSSEALLEHFEKIVGSLMSKIGGNEHQQVSLTKLRDTLLPKLISGELQIPDAEQQRDAALA